MLTLLVLDHKPSAPLPTACQHLALPLLSLRQRTRCRAPCAARVRERSGDTVGVWREREAERERGEFSEYALYSTLKPYTVYSV